MTDVNGVWYGLMEGRASNPPRILIIGAGSRGLAYADAVTHHTAGQVCAVAEPIAFKRHWLGKKYIWQHREPQPGQEFAGWREFLKYELDRRARVDRGEETEPGIDGVFICTLDEQHADAIRNLAPLKLHTLCEKPLATSLEDCLSIYKSLKPSQHDKSVNGNINGSMQPDRIFSIGHVLRYSPHNMLLRDLVLDEKVIGDVLSVEHTEPVGWWHFAHSYVRGNWRKESSTAPSLLTKSCHDIDFILWLLCSPTDPTSEEAPHLPAKITSSGALNYFRKARKPAEAGNATNCLSCPIESRCKYSARKIYDERFLKKGDYRWPVKIVNPEIEDIYHRSGPAAASTQLLRSLEEDYNAKTVRPDEISKRPWFGRCVWESDNDVCDDQTVTISWDDEGSHFAKTATFHMIAHTEAQCERRGRIYGTDGEIEYDSTTIVVHDFATGERRSHRPEHHFSNKKDSRLGHHHDHGGGDQGLTQKFVQAIEAVKNGGMPVSKAQARFIGCTLDEIIRSHAVIFAAEDARKSAKVIDWKQWWATHQ